MKLPPTKEWFSWLENLSLTFQRYGSFLPEQTVLLQRVYEKLARSDKPVWVFVAPPASGKTHVICLLAKTFSEASQKTAVVVPNNYLKEEFEAAGSEVSGGLRSVDILNISEYLRTNTRYDFVLVDEAHNLKSFIELDPSLVRSLDLTPDEELYSDLASRYLPPDKAFVAQRLSFSSAKGLLTSLSHIPKFRRRLKPILDEPTLWTYFIYMWRDSPLCTLRFVRAGRLCEFKLPNKHLLMFSASPLSNKELSFYCGISHTMLERAPPVHSEADWREKGRLYISITDDLTTKAKAELLENLIKASKTRTLVLFNTSRSCQKVYNRLKKDRRIFTIMSRSEGRIDTYKQFLNYADGVLLTSSTIFWEGITIKGLKLLVVAEPPFPRPHLMDLIKGKLVDGKRDMRRRLEQGLGRIGRRKGEWGIGVVLFDTTRICGRVESLIGDSKLLKMKSWDCMTYLHNIFANKSSFVEPF